MDMDSVPPSKPMSLEPPLVHQLQLSSQVPMLLPLHPLHQLMVQLLHQLTLHQYTLPLLLLMDLLMVLMDMEPMLHMELMVLDIMELMAMVTELTTTKLFRIRIRISEKMHKYLFLGFVI